MMPFDVLCFGEALIDMRGERVDGQLRFVPQPGGAPANVAVGVAWLGGRSGFAGQVGADLFGDQILTSLSGFGVDTSLLVQTHSANTALAMVALDEAGERSFTFYRNSTADLLYEPEQLPDSAFAGQPIFHICSNTLTEPVIVETTLALVARARKAGCLVSFDVNYRESLWPDPDRAPAQIRALAMEADLVKFSREELTALYGQQGDALVGELCRHGVQLVLVSDGPNALHAWAGDRQHTLAPPRARAVDTTAAGDAFVAGLLHQLAGHGVTAERLGPWLAQPASLDLALEFASRCGAMAATRFGAFDALPSKADLRDL
ncbi:carbohydrate kinase [Marinobacter sp. NFXS11]|uniref:carbohydrate kinase family protein n=1 Tax=Marinobacter sp. NFXS11 TaxID=2818432 RepID=UPI0032DF9709